MYRYLVYLAPAILFAGQARYARMGDMDGKVEVQLHAADPWTPAERNLTLTENAWLRTAAASRVEIELDDGSALRLGADSLVELSDYTRLSTGQRVTLLSLDHGVAWFTGEPTGHDSLSLALPGAQITLSHGARVRVEAAGSFSRVAVIEGVVRLSCADADLDLREGQTGNVEPAGASRFSLERGIAAMELDPWSEQRDQALAAPASGGHVPLAYGVADLDTAGEWLATDAGAVWKPKVGEGWAPFQKGRWRWYDTLGYTWVSDESWGWLPYHYGRWTRRDDQGWVWVPPAAAPAVFKPGDVYWLYGRNLAGWGPLAPGEVWLPSAAPRQFLNVNTTYAAFAADARVIDPAGFAPRPREPLSAAVFALALPSPALLPGRLEAKRPALRVGATRAIAPVVPDAAFDANPVAPPPAVEPPAVVANPASDAPPVVQPGPPPDPGAPGPPIVYPVPVYTGVIVMNPPEHPDYSRRNPNNPPSRGTTQPAATSPTPGTPATPATPSTAAIQVPHIEQPRIGAPAPQRTDKPRVEAPPPARGEQPRVQPRVEAPSPARVEQPRVQPRVETPAPARVEQPRVQPRVEAPVPARVEQPRATPAPAPAKTEPDKSEPAKTDTASRKQ